MKKLFVSVGLLFLSITGFSQCNPDGMYTGLGLPGVYPPAIQIPNLPLPLGIADGSLGSSYSQTLTLVVLEDTTMDIGFLLPNSVDSIMNVLVISTIMTVDVNHATFDVQDLPSGINYQCDISSCQYPSSTDGCIQLSGTPTVAGDFDVPVNMVLNVQIPSIANPIPGLPPVFAGMAVDLPSFPINEYDLHISDGSTSISDVKNNISIYPNPANSFVTISTSTPKIVRIYNSLGQEVYSEITQDDIFINKSEIGSGIFIVEISDNNSVEKHKLIIN